MHFQNLFAFPGPETLGVMIPIVAIVGGLAIGMVSSMQNHQRKMAEIIHGNKNSELLQSEIEELRRDVAQLKSTVATQALALEGVAKRTSSIGESSGTDALSQRLG